MTSQKVAGIEGLSLALLLTFLSTHSQVRAAYYDNESSLRADLLKDYQYTIRPSKQVTVMAMLSFLNINILDVPSQRLSISGWLSFTWEDPRLSWDPALYAGITDIFDTELVFWRPEIIVDNSVNNLGVLESDKLLIRAMYNGNMKWEPPGIFDTHCNVDVTFYPFDTQLCVVEVTSWAQTVKEIDLYPNGTKIDLLDYRDSGEWDVLDSWTDRKELTDGADTHSEITFSIKLQRKPMYYITTILIPVIVTSILCIVVFMLPAEAGEKVGYSLTIMLTYTVMLTLVASYMPPTSKHTSVLSVYLTIILFIGMFTTFITVVVLHLHHHPENKDIPKWVLFLTRNIMVPISRWSPQPKPRETDQMCEETASNLSHNKTHPEAKGHVNMIHCRYNSSGRGKDTLTPVGDQKHVIQSASRRVNQTDERDNNYVKYIIGQGSNFESKPENRVRNENLRAQCPSSKDHRFTWKELGVILDAFCLRVLGGFVLALTLIVLMAMIIGGRLTVP